MNYAFWRSHTKAAARHIGEAVNGRSNSLLKSYCIPPEMIPLLSQYFLSITPAFLVWLVLLIALPKQFVIPRVMLHIFFFIHARDAITANGFWQITSGDLRFTAPVAILLTLAAVSAILFMAVWRIEADARKGMRWLGESFWHSMLIGILGAALVSVVAATLKNYFALTSTPAPAVNDLLMLLAFALVANAYEELLFRGLLQNTLSKTISPARAALISGFFFCFCHANLAMQVGHASVSILLFTLIEGIAAAFVYNRAGLLGATLTHGLAVFALAAGIY